MNTYSDEKVILPKASDSEKSINNDKAHSKDCVDISNDTKLGESYVLYDK